MPTKIQTPGPSPIVKAALEVASAKTGVPYKILDAVAWAESAYNPDAKSKAGAAGLMQIMPQNLAHYGITNALDPAQSALGGAKMLSSLFQVTRDWNKTFACYNWGIGNVTKKPDPNDWPTETRNYITKLNRRLGRPNPFPGSREKTPNG